MIIFLQKRSKIFFFAKIRNQYDLRTFFDVYYMSVGQKKTISKIHLIIVTLMILGKLEAAPEKTMQLRV
jgi:hypothetical protein